MTDSDNTELAVAIGVSSDLAFAAAVTFLNFSKVHPGIRVTYYLYSDRRLKRVGEVLKRLGLNVKVVKYEPPISWSTLWGSRSVAYFSPLVLSKLEALSLLQSHKKVLWLDYDIVLLRPLDELLATDSSMSFVQGVELAKSFERSNEFSDEIHNFPGVNAGVMFFTRNFPSPESNLARLYQLFKQYSNNLRLPEQGIFGLFLFESRLRVNYLDEAIYCARVGSQEAKGNPLILHSPYKKKFWNSGGSSLVWQKYYEAWKRAGGESFLPWKHNLTKLGRMIRYVVASSVIAFWANGNTNPR